MGCSSEIGMNSKENYIIAELEVSEYEDNYEIEIINSYEHFCKRESRKGC